MTTTKSTTTISPFKRWVAKHVRARYVHHFEAFTDNVVGLGINFVLVMLVYNMWLGQDISINENIKGSLAFFVAAYIRKYTIRRWTSHAIGKLYDLKDRIDAEVQEQTGKD
jgi:hypothetical protein